METPTSRTLSRMACFFVRPSRTLSARWRALFSTTTMESSTRMPSERMSAKSVMRLMSRPNTNATTKTMPRTMGMQNAALAALRSPRNSTSTPKTMPMLTKRWKRSSLVACRAVSPSLATVSTDTSPGRVFLASSTTLTTSSTTVTAFDPLALETPKNAEGKVPFLSE